MILVPFTFWCNHKIVYDAATLEISKLKKIVSEMMDKQTQ